MKKNLPATPTLSPVKKHGKIELEVSGEDRMEADLKTVSVTD